MMMKYGMLICLVTLSMHPAYAEESEAATKKETAIPLNFESVSKRAWTDARAVLIADAQLVQAEALSKNDTSILKPQINLEVLYQHQDEGDPGLGQSPLEERSSASINAQQLLYGFGLRAQSQAVARQRSLAAHAQRNNSGFTAVRTARLALVQSWLAMANVEVNKNRVEQRQQELHDVKQKEAAGTAAGIDTRLAEINFLTAKNNLLDAEAQLAKQTAALKQTLNIEQEHEVSIANELAATPAFDLVFKRAELSIADSSSTQTLQAQAEQAQAQAEQVSSGRYPQIYALASYAGVGEEFGDLSDQWMLGVSLQWNLYDGSAKIAQRDSFIAQAQSLNESQLDLIAKRAELLKQLTIDHKQLLQRLEQQQQIIQLSEKNYQDTRALYQVGNTTITRLGESSLNLEEARFALNNILASLHSLYTELLYFTEMPPVSAP